MFEIPLTITAGHDDLMPRPQCFGNNNQVQDYNTNGQIKGFENYLTKEKKHTFESNLKRRFKDNLSYFKVLNQNGTIVHMPVESTITVFGYIKVTIIYGSVSVFGFNLHKRSFTKSITMFGSKELKTFPIKAYPHNDGNYSHLKDLFISSIPLADGSINSLMSSINLNDSIILIEELPYPSIFYAKQYINSNMFPIDDKIRSGLPKSANCAIYVVREEHNSFLESHEWQSLPLGKRNIIIGGEGTGKSTLTKYIINHLFNKNKAVLFLELDIGQGEFTPPGCVALIILRQPILGPNFTHVLEPERMIHLGEVDAGKCSSEYLTSVQILVDDINQKFSDLPLVVNTMGYCKGLGLHLIMQTIKTLRPSSVIQLNSKSMKRNFEKHMTPQVVSRNRFTYNFSLIQSISFGSKRPGSKREARERMLISYFSSVLIPPYFSFNTAEPYSVPFANVSIGVAKNVAIKDVLSALNGCLVALCDKPAAESKILKTNVPEWFDIVLKPPVQHCFGLGLVRGIDMDKRLIYILTPVSIVKLQNVGVLQMSQVEVPSAVFTKQEGIDGLVPYVTKLAEDISLVPVKRVFRQTPQSSTKTKLARTAV